MSNNTSYLPKYENSWALVIGINSYRKAPPLKYARFDAEELAVTLEQQFGFPQSNIKLLLDEDAARNAIMAAFLAFAGDSVTDNDRILVFFAGHGYTRSGRRGEVGYLVPVDGDTADLSTLIRWDDLTKNSELIAAKHLIFIMDACYGGLAVTRALPPGSMRFLKDMLQRYSRQVLTAGKADEVVADAGGPRQGHSVFTGHLLDALEGAAVTSDGIISANAVMAYVYDHVAKDPHSQQTPHYGFLDGDGDFIFVAPTLNHLSIEEKTDTDVLIQVPANLTALKEGDDTRTLTELIKEYLSESRYRIRLDDLVAAEIRAALQEISEEQFPLQTATVTTEDFVTRLHRYEKAMNRLMSITILLAYWGTEDHQSTLEKIITRLADNNEQRGGVNAWLGLRWYPLMVLMYVGGIAALSTENYRSLSTLLLTKLGTRLTGMGTQEAIIPTVSGLYDDGLPDLFKRLPGHERNYVPRSEYLLKTLQPNLEDLLFLGSSYEDVFDRFEVFYALVFADMVDRKSGNLWGPPGRFGWKHRGRLSTSPYDALLAEAKQLGDTWPPLRAGFFGGSLEHFEKIAVAYREQLLNHLPWH